MSNTSDPAHLADTVFHKAFRQYFGERLPLHLGRELFGTTRRRLSSEGLHPEHHADEIFSRVMAQAFEHIRNNGADGIRDPRAWFHGIARNATHRYLGELFERDTQSVYKILAGEVELPHVQINDEERLMKLIREAIEGLAPRHREFILLDLQEGLPREQIKESMGIRSDGYFRKLKCEAFKALRIAIRALIESLF